VHNLRGYQEGSYIGAWVDELQSHENWVVDNHNQVIFVQGLVLLG